MCGRYTLRTPARTVAQRMGVDALLPFEPRYNIAPTQAVAVVRSTVPGQRELALVRWGLIPSWSHDPAISHRLLNARAETAASKPAFRSAFRSRRCLVPADAFYEWQKLGKHKQPYLIGLRNGDLFAFAGLWEQGTGTDGEPVETCTILTTEANELVRPLHERMPVILKLDDYGLWLDPHVREAEAVEPLLKPYPAGEMSAYPVSAFVSNPRHEGPQCVEPLSA